MNVNKVVSLKSDTRIPHEARILHYRIIAFLLIDAEAEIWLLNGVTIFLLNYIGEGKTFYTTHGCENEIYI